MNCNTINDEYSVEDFRIASIIRRINTLKKKEYYIALYDNYGQIDRLNHGLLKTNKLQQFNWLGAILL